MHVYVVCVCVCVCVCESVCVRVHVCVFVPTPNGINSHSSESNSCTVFLIIHSCSYMLECQIDLTDALMVVTLIKMLTYTTEDLSIMLC